MEKGRDDPPTYLSMLAALGSYDIFNEPFNTKVKLCSKLKVEIDISYIHNNEQLASKNVR